MGEQTPVIAMHGITRHHVGPTRVEALAGITLIVGRGDVLAITGPSGSGKSTLLQIAGLLDRPTGGTYAFDGVDTVDLPGPSLDAMRAEQIGFVFQAFHLVPHLDVVGNVELGLLYGRPPRHARRRGRRARRELALAALDRLGLAHLAAMSPTVLSGGEQQRIAIARAVVRAPSLILCDEPTGNLDRRSGDRVLELLSDLRREGSTVVVATHDPEVAAWATRRVELRDGRVSGAEELR